MVALAHRLRLDLRPFPWRMVLAVCLGVALGVAAGSLLAPAGGSDRGPASVRSTPAPRVTSRVQVEAAARSVVRRYFTALAQGSDRRAWQLLSSRSRARYANAAGGYAKWRSTQQQAFAGADVLTVQVRELSADRREAAVYVRGVNAQHGCRFAGLTWLRLDLGRWRYDPGYASTAGDLRLPCSAGVPVR